jgi:hypothetical protein
MGDKRVDKAAIWLAVIELCLKKEWTFDFSEYPEALAETMKQVCAVRLAAQAACEESGLDFDEGVAHMRAFLDEQQGERAA